MFFIKIALLASTCFPNGLSTQDSERSNRLTDQPVSHAPQYSILVRTDEPSVANQSSDTITRVAKLPHRDSKRPVRTSLTQAPESQAPASGQADWEQPIQLQITGAELYEAGQLQTFKIKIKNRSRYNLELAEIRVGIPPGYRFQDSDVLAQFDSSRNVAAWKLDTLGPNDELKIHFRAVAVGQGPQLYQVSLVQQQRIQLIQNLQTFIVDSQLQQSQPLNQAADRGTAPIVESERLPRKSKKY